MRGNTYINNINKLVYNATAFANVADNAASSPLTNIYMALHTADPGAGGGQNTSEATYAGYARQAVARTTGGFTITTQQIQLAANVPFPAAGPTATDVLRFWSTGSLVSGAGIVFHSGPIGSNLGVGTAVAATDTITLPGLTGVAVGDQVAFYAPLGGTIPTGITAGTIYFVKTVSGNDITISTTSGGSTLDITAAGEVLAFKTTPITLGAGLTVTPSVGAGTLVVEL